MAVPRSAIQSFTPALLRNIQARLISPILPRELPAHTKRVTPSSSSLKGRGRTPTEAAVLIPLMNINEKPHVLMEVRNKGLRVHAGEASFPGGKADDTDSDLIHTALREAYEELALPSDHVQILGRLEPEYSLGNKTRVWPFVGFIHSNPSPFPLDSPSNLSSLSLENLIPSPDEVSALLPLPLSVFHDDHRNRLSTHYFRLDVSKPYHKIKCDDLVVQSPTPQSNIDSLPNTGGGQGNDLESSPHPRGMMNESASPGQKDDHEGLEVWGLSGWFLNKLAERVGWTNMPPKGQAPED